MPKKNKNNIEDLIKQFHSDGPEAVLKTRTRLNIEDAELLCAEVKKEGVDIAPYDFQPVPKYTWTDAAGYPTDNARKATKQLVASIAERQGIEYRTVDGFKMILPQLTRYAFYNEPINKWGTRLGEMLEQAYSNSTSVAIYDLVRNDPAMREINDKINNPLRRSPDAEKECIQ